MGSPAAASAAATAAGDSAQWLSVKEETIFLHDGLIRVTDLAELPSEIVGVAEPGDTELEILTFETKNPTELAERLRSVCGNQSNAYARLLEYRLNALRGLWNAQRQLALEEQHDRESSGDEEALALLKRQGLLQQPEQAPFTSRMGLLLVFPLIQSQSRTDPSLCNITAEVLLNCLRDCQPLSLTKEPADCLNGIESLLCSWLEETSASGHQIPYKQKENAAAALVALACARGSLKTFVHTVHLLQKQTDLGTLPVADVLYRLLLLEGGPGSPSCLLGGKHIVSWGFEDMLPAPDANSSSSGENKDADLGRCLAADGLYLYTTNSVGKGISKLGSGLHGTLRGFVYCRNEELEAGWVAFGNSKLLHRPVSFDNKPHSLFQVVDQHTLQVCQIIPMPVNHFPVGSTMTTVHLSSDGTYFYWIWSPASLNEKTPKGHSVFMDVFELTVENGVCIANPLQERIILMRKEGESAKSINEMLLSRLSRYRASPSATLAALTGSTISNTLKEDQAAANTSCGLPLKMLRKTPIYTCGTYLVMLVPPPGGSGSSATRSLFGGTSALSSLKILASSLVFNISDGQFTSRADLIDAAGSSLGRGALVPGLGACYDTMNNMIWTCSNDYIDQWCNPGNQAFHCVCQRLGVSHVITEPKGDATTTNEVINQLLHHVGAMCIHQLNLLAASNNLPITNFLGKQHPIEAHHLSSICDIMEKAMVNGDTCIIRCILVVFQVVFKFFFSPQTERNRDIVRRSGLLLWQLLMAPRDQICAEIQKEVCLAISSGLNILYPGEAEINNLLKLVLTEGERNSGLSQLRDVILTNLAEQLQNNRFGSEDDDHYRLNDELLHYILKIVVRESCVLITKCQTVSKDDFQRLLSTVPAASSCLRYLMAVQNHLLSNTILIKPDENDDSDSSLQGETLKELKTSILSLATQILTGCDEVLEMLQQVTTALINSDIADREQRLKGLEQITKATMLGHLLPVLLTSLMHPNLQTLTMADALMPQLVQLVLYTSQTALLLKTQSPVFSELNSSPSGVSEQKGKLLHDERMLEEKEEPGFLTGLKIPAPWAAGKTVETVHPVRDNYKFKETVHIPGARCLYLRFDNRCSSQYDYDKLVIYAGPNTNSRKVAEYGGNTLGYGSRSVLGTGWPKDLVKVEGDTVTFSFEMRSGREHNTPDKAMWGFACTVRAQESSEDVSGGLPFLVDLALGLSVLACSMLRILYNGPEITKDEETCQELLRSKLLQRCQWQVEANGVISPALTPSPSPLPLTIDEDREFTYPSDVLVPPIGHYFDLPRIRLPPGIMIKLREISGRARPQFRPSIKEVIQPEVMEEMVVSCVIKHLNLVDALQSLINFQYQEEHAEEYDLLCKIMGETFKKLNAMERQLQSVAELEQKWQSEVDDAMHGKLENNVPFFYDYHFNEVNKMKELELLCSMKEVSFDGSDLENVVLALREKFFQEVNSLIQRTYHPLAKTKALVKSLMNRAELLLHVTIAAQSGITRSISGTPAETPACKSASETKVISHAVRQPVFLRSMSAPSDLEMIGNEDIEFARSSQRRRHVTSHRSSSFTLLQSLAIEDSRDKPTYSVLLGQLFAFIGTNPDQAVSSSSFLLAAQTRWRRGNTRKQALVHMRELLTAAVRVGGVTHLVGPVTMVLQGGPRIEELTCGGMVEQVQEAFGETMTSVVSLCARYPIACANSIGLLCTIPYTRSEEKCLVRSGLVQLMDRLCSLSSQTESSSNEKQTKKQKVATMAWAAFQVLANRCVEWEKEEGGSTEAVHSGLARQVSSLLTNHLARATECCGNQAAGNDALQDVLSLLNDLSRSHIGKAILSQPACVSKLLSLLLDQRPSPKLVLIILQLCRAALPLMSVEDCGNVELPPWSYSVPSLNSEQDDPSDPASKIASLLLAKLADYVVPGCQTVLSPTASEPDTALAKSSPKSSIKGDKDPGEESEAVDGKLSIFIHKREDQSSHEVLQPLLSSSEGRPFRLGTGANMEKVVKMDRDMTKSGCCEVITEEAAAALRKATKWAQSGLIVSVGPPIETVNPEATSGMSTGDKKKTAQTSICRERNSELARTDPVRPFISGHVANSMAAEVIALLHSLLMAPESNAAQIWTTTAEKVLSRALMYIPQLGKYAESILENGSSSGRKLAKLQRIARQAVAALCALGGFKETIKIGSEVQVLGKGIAGSIGVVASINEQEGIATVKFPPTTIDSRKTSQASDTLTIPLSRLCVPRSEALPLHKLSITEKVVQAVQSMLLPQEGSLSIHTSLPATGDANCMGERLTVVEMQCERLRMLYRDCARPPPPPLQADRRQPKEITWSPSRVFPPVRACMFSSHLAAVTFLADPSAGGGLPRGTFIYATSPVPVQAPSFYWEIEIVSYGDTDDDTGPIVSFGFATEAEKRDGAWTNPVGTCLFHNNGRAVHYNGSSLLQWKSVRLDVTLSPGDVAGIGWERTEGTPPPPGQPAKGRVYFTYCGQRLGPYLEDVSGGMWPIVHIQKKNTKVRANFGSRQFAYAEGQAHRNAADLCIDLAEEISANFEALPFAMASDSDNDAGTSIASDPGTHGPPCRIAAVATAQQQYDSDTSCHYKMELSYENFITSGPDPHPPPIADDESDDDDDDDIPREDHYALLVKAWETKVFPTIRRRFRNEAERKSGLDQIKGALQLGMVDIARQTVEFLYEENGGIPRDLYLPTIEDIKDEANKFTIDKVRKGLTVVTRSPDSNNVTSSAVGTALPKFAIRGMLKTFGLHGVVLDVDSVNELVQVETYLRSEGVLVRYWYPIDMLERPPAGYRRTATNGLVTLDNTNIQIHRELLRSEAALAKLYCRMALLNIFAPKSPHMFTRLFHIPAIRDITLEHLQLLSNQLLAPPLPDGTISSSSILLAQSLQHCIHSQNCAATDLFYQGNSQAIREWLTVAITRTLHQGEESLLDLTKQICSFLQTAPEQFPAEEFPISESKVNMDVNFPGAAFVIVSCKESQSGFRKDSSLYKAPWARVLVYGLGHKVKRNGQLNLIEAVCYPRDASPTNTGLTPPPTTNQYPSVITPTDKVHIKLGVSPPPGAVLVLHSLPLEFPLAMAFTEQLLTWKLEDVDGKSEDELDTIPPSVLLQVVEFLGNFLWTTDMAASVKELIFHLLAELLRKIHNLEQKKNPAGLSSSIALQLNPCLAMLMALQSELHKLYDEETQNWVSGNACGGSGVGAADQGRFSTYFHALMEVCLAVAEVTLPINMSVTANVISSTSAPNLSDSSSSSSSSPGQTPQSPSLLSKRKKVKMKREKTSSSGKRSSSRAAETDAAILNIGGSKPEDMLWFHRALTLLIILRHLTKKDPQGLGVTNDAVADACQALVGPTAHSRLLVISGIPTHLEESTVRNAIRKACNAHGGVFKDEIYIPLQEEDPKKIKDKAEGGECRTELEKPTVSSSADSLDISSSSSVTPAMSVSASASTSQASLCSSQGISRTVSDISVDQYQAGLELAIPPGLLEPHVSSQESLDLSHCSTGSLGSLGSLGEPLDNVETASVSDVGSMYTVTSLDNQQLLSRPIKGFAVVEIRSRAKIEKIRASLFNSSDLIGLSSLDGEDELMEMSTEEILTVSTVNQSLFDTQGSPALEDYFNDKSIKGEKLVPGAREVLTEIFKSCVHSEQMLSLTPTKPIKVADIYLSKEQINSQTPGNLLHVFFTNVRPPKKVLEDQLTQILRKYGVPKPKFDKSKYNKAGKEQHPVKVVSTKRPVTKPPTKEKSMLNSVSRTALSEKKPTVKPKSPEKIPEEKYLTLDGFHRFVVDRSKQDIRSVWRAILSCGYDLHFERCACIDARHAQKASRKWTLEMDVALVQYINRLCRHLAITPARLHPHEVYLDPADAADPRISCLLNVPVESLRLRFALLQSLNTTLETFFLPLVELRQTEMYSNSIAALLQEAKGLIFYDTKITVMNRVLNATVQRTADHAAPEITLDPLEIVGGEIRSSENSYFCQAARQLACVPSSQLCVKLASGGDPTYAFNIRFTGEEVHGTSGSFRHFLWQVCKELQSSSLSLLLLCPSSAVNKNKGKYILTPSPITYAEEQLFHFFGQLLGIAIRADVPLPLDLLPSFWKTLVGEPLDPDVDLQEADILTYNYIKKFENINDETELEALCAEIASQHLATESPDCPNKPCCKFTYLTMTGEEVELCPRGRHVPVGWENKDVYAAAIRNLRMRELQTPECMTAVRAGLGSIIPLQLLTTLTPLEMELRTCGLPYINLEFLKAHTMYQVGLMETDQHIEFFWSALEMFTQEELCKFIKFACNQERIPFTCPCKDGGPDTAHVPPYPMKIAPPDGAAGSPDSRYIRVETCMFMIKLPQYSSLDIMLEKLRYAIHYREDPLSG
uniref:HECT domain E3 ubiquitin protein ligase 4 n=1 Tax=Phasianus colchicus TaxID=9054 RepID=A0A669P9X0_PHACC